MYSNFVAKSMEYQDSAMNAPQAIKMFEKSCAICCMRNVRLDCDRCPVRFYHEQIMKVKFPHWKKTKRTDAE